MLKRYCVHVSQTAECATVAKVFASTQARMDQPQLAPQDCNLLAQLKVLAQIRVGDKLETRSQSIAIDAPALFRGARRWVYGEDRLHTVAAVVEVVSRAIQRMQQCAPEARSHSWLHPLYVKDLQTAQAGLLNLQLTYTRCPQTVAQFQVLSQNIDASLADAALKASSSDCVGGAREAFSSAASSSGSLASATGHPPSAKHGSVASTYRQVHGTRARIDSLPVVTGAGRSGETAHSGRTADTHCGRTGEAAHSGRTADTHSGRTGETAYSGRTSEAAHSGRTAEAAHSGRTAETAHSGRTADTHRGCTGETAHSGRTADTHCGRTAEAAPHGDKEPTPAGANTDRGAASPEATYADVSSDFDSVSDCDLDSEDDLDASAQQTTWQS